MGAVTALLVDDDDDVRDVIEDGLRAAGFDVIATGSAGEALERVAAAPDVIVLDVSLPDMNGVDLCARLKASPATSTTPILLISGIVTAVEARVLGLERGADAYLTKPFVLSELIATIRALLRARRAEEQAEVGSALLTLADAIGGLVEFGEILDTVVQVTPKLLGVGRCAVFLTEPDSGSIVPAAATGMSAAAWVALNEPSMDCPLPALSDAIESRQLVQITPATLDRHVEAGARGRLDIQSMLVVPLTSRGRVLGALTLDTPGADHALTPKQVTIARGIASHAALAIDRARSHRDATRRLAEAEALTEVSRMLSRSLDRKEVSHAIVDSVRTLLDADVTLLLEVGDGEELEEVAHSGLDPGGWRLRVTEVPTDSAVATRWMLQAGGARVRAVLTAPLVVEGQTIGVLVAVGRSGAAFTSDEMRAARGFAAHAALAFQNARLFAHQQVLLEQTRRRREEAMALESVVQKITASLDLADVMTRIVDAAREVCGADVAIVAPYDEATDSATIVASAGARTDTFRNLTLHRGRGVAGIVLETGRPFATDDYLNDARITQDYAAGVRAEAIVSEVGVPIRFGQAITGILITANRSARPFTPADVRVLTRLADHAAIAIANSRLYGEVTRAMTQREHSEAAHRALAELSQRALESTPLDSLLTRAPVVMARILGTEYATVLEASPDGAEFRIRAGVGWPAGSIGRVVVASSPDAPAARALLSGEPVCIEDFEAETGFERPRFLAEHDVRSVAVLAIHGLIPPFGVIDAASKTPRRFTDEDVAFMRSVANIVAIALARARAEARVQRQTEGLRILRDLDQAILSARSTREIADAALERLGDLLGGWVSVRVFDFDAGVSTILASRGTPADRYPPGVWIPLEEVGLADIEELRRGAAVIVQDLAALPAPAPVLARLIAVGLRSHVRMPLIADGQLVGALNFGTDRPNAFGLDHLELAREISRPLAVALAQARLHEQVAVAREQLRGLSRSLVEVQERERRHLARELHDEIGQILTGLSLTMESSVLRGGDSERLTVAVQLVNELIQRVRDLSLELRPTVLDDFGLLAALVAHFKRYTAQTGVHVNLRHTGVEGRRFAGAIETAAYRIVQEALTNVARHAGVETVTVRLWTDEGTLGVQVDDRGCGLPAGALSDPRSSGLASIRERATLLGGWVEVESSPGAGVRVRAEIPLAEAPGARPL
jgi:GAF domain-containing protein/CheY-like chemotaxis protein